MSPWRAFNFDSLPSRPFWIVDGPDDEPPPALLPRTPQHNFSYQECPASAPAWLNVRATPPMHPHHLAGGCSILISVIVTQVSQHRGTRWVRKICRSRYQDNANNGPQSYYPITSSPVPPARQISLYGLQNEYLFSGTVIIQSQLPRPPPDHVQSRPQLKLTTRGAVQ
ncbi:hypothetical protein C8Q78DRAFT_279656 [Trametes maxima]|nr:hypothetical protein C8Q78DRAFT_279656 [Trametes maxima]